MAVSANEQYLLELINRARLDPLSEAERYGLSDLNRGLDSGTITADPKQVLAGHDFLDIAANSHSQWMLDNNVFSHIGADGSTAGERMEAAGYAFTGFWTWGENISWTGTTGKLDFDAQIDSHHRSLFLSDGHRANILSSSFREIGLGQVQGDFTSGGTTYNASMLTQNFAKSGAAIFVTGVIYNDSDGDRFYSRGEGVGGVNVSVAGGSATASAAAGGYAIATGGGEKTISIGGATVTVDLSGGNGKLDLVDGNHVMTSVDINLHSGVSKLTLLGAGNINATGTDGADHMIGNSGDNILYGGRGNDVLYGGAGDDVLYGGPGNDRMYGGPGDDVLYGGPGNDRLYGGPGDDVLRGGGGDDVLFGGPGNDLLFGGPGNDVLRGGGGDDVLRGGGGDDRLFGGPGNDRLFGGPGDDVLRGGGGDDVLRGGAGNDRLYGGPGDDRLYGGPGDDVLFAGPGRDVLFGGSGADRFVYTNVDHIGTGADSDVIRDFVPGTDLLDLARIDANTQVAGNQAFSFIGAAPFTQAGQLRYENDILSGDVTGNGQADFELRFANSALLSTDDFLL